MNDIRASFEKWATNKWGFDASKHIYGGIYRSPDMQAAWEAWQARQGDEAVVRRYIETLAEIREATQADEDYAVSGIMAHLSAPASDNLQTKLKLAVEALEYVITEFNQARLVAHEKFQPENTRRSQEFMDYINKALAQLKQKEVI